MYPIVDLGEKYVILGIHDENLDFEQSDEQVLLVRTTQENQKMELLIASTSTVENEYGIVWKQELVPEFLTGISLRIEDITGNGRKDIMVSGFNEEGIHVVEIFGMPNNGKLQDYLEVFSLHIEGNIDILTMERSVGYFSGTEEGNPYRIVVQQRDPESDNELDIVETEWTWNKKGFAFEKRSTRQVKVETLLEERLARVYSGDAVAFEDYLNSTWYQDQGNETFNRLLYFDPKSREILFYDGGSLEIFDWGTSHRTTAKRLYTRISNQVIPSINETIWISAESWDRIELTRANKDWSASYHRLNTPLQSILRDNLAIKSIMSKQAFVGSWKNADGQEIIFDLPRIEWRVRDRNRLGTAVLLNMQESTLLQVQFLRRNGATGNAENWLVDYNEQSNGANVIRSITLTPAILEASGVKSIETDSLLFEQVELPDISP